MLRFTLKAYATICLCIVLYLENHYKVTDMMLRCNLLSFIKWGTLLLFGYPQGSEALILISDSSSL